MTAQIHTPATLILVKGPPVSVEFVAGWAPEPDWMFWRRDMSFASARNRVKIPPTYPALLMSYC